MFCPKCGAELPDGATFCTSCGTKLVEGSPAEQAPAANTTSTPAVSAQKVAVRQKPLVVPIVAAVAIIGLAIALFMTGGFGLFGGSGVEVKAKTNDYTWEELSAISAEISRAGSEERAIGIAKKYHLCNEDGTLDGTQRKNVTLSNGNKTAVEIIGFNHDDKSDGSGKAGITFMFVDAIAYERCIESQYSPGSIDWDDFVAWKDYDLRARMNGDWLSDYLPDDLVDVVVEVEKLTQDEFWPTETCSVTPTSDSFWLLSYTEIVGVDTESFINQLREEYPEALDGDREDYYRAAKELQEAEGHQYKLFRDSEVSEFDLVNSWQIRDDNNLLSKQPLAGGTNVYWWLRSSAADFQGACWANVMYRSDSSASTNLHNLDDYAQVVPGFCI